MKSSSGAEVSVNANVNSSPSASRPAQKLKITLTMPLPIADLWTVEEDILARPGLYHRTILISIAKLKPLKKSIVTNRRFLLLDLNLNNATGVLDDL
jgi:hypothetical protein